MATVALTQGAFDGTPTTITLAGTVMTADGQHFNYRGGQWFCIAINGEAVEHTLTVKEQPGEDYLQDRTVTLPASDTVVFAGDPGAVVRNSSGNVEIYPEAGEGEHITVHAFYFVPSKE